MDYRIFPLEDQSRLGELCALFAKGLADTAPDYWKWKHFSENGHPEGRILVAETEAGSIAGMFALQPVRYTCGGREVVMIQTQDLVIDPGCRGTGLMKKLFRFAEEYYTQKNAAGFMAFCNENSYPIFLKYGSRDMGDIFSYNSGKKLLPVYTRKKRECIDDWQIAFLEEAPHDLFYPGSDNAFSMKKNDGFMRWKFSDNPDGPFRWLTIRREGRLEGYLVVQVTQGRLRRAVNIYDWALTDGVPEKVLKAVIDLLKTHGNWVSLWGRYSEAELERWAKGGIAEKSVNGSHFLLYPFEGAELPENWRLTRADLDY